MTNFSMNAFIGHLLKYLKIPNFSLRDILRVTSVIFISSTCYESKSVEVIRERKTDRETPRVHLTDP